MAYVRKQITLSPFVSEMLKKVSEAEGESISSIINDAVKDYVRTQWPDIDNQVRKSMMDEGAKNE